MQLTWIPSRRRFVGTQTEAKAEKAAFEIEDVPVVKADLIAYLNAREQRHEQELAALRAEVETLQGGGEEGSDEAPAPVAAETPKSASPGAKVQGEILEIDEQVMELEHPMLIRVLSAAIGRLGELAGTRGWAAFAKDVYGWSPAARSVEQGLGMLMLAAFDSFGMDPNAPKKPRYEPIAPPEKGQPTE